MPSPQRSVTFWDVPYGTEDLVAVGNVMIPTEDGTSWLVATSGNRGTRRCEAIAMTAFAGSGSGTVELQSVGTIDASISGLGAGDASWVRCSSTGLPERVASPSGSDDIIGFCETDGRLHLLFGLFTPGIINGGVAIGGTDGQAQYNNGGVLGGMSGLTYDESTDRPLMPNGCQLANNQSIYGRNVADSAWVAMLRLGNSDWITLGDAAHNIFFHAGTGSFLVNSDSHQFRTGDGSAMIASFVPAGVVLRKDGAEEFGGGDGVIAIQNATTVPTTNPVNGVVLYPQSGVLKYRQPGGTVSILNGDRPAAAIAVLAIDWSAASIFTKSISGNSTFTFSNATSGLTITVRVTATGAFTATWPSVTWLGTGGAAPTQKATGTTVYTFFHDGSVIYGQAVDA